MIVRLTSVDISWKLLKKYLSKKYAKHSFNYERTLSRNVVRIHLFRSLYKTERNVNLQMHAFHVIRLLSCHLNELNKYIASMYIGLSLVSQNLLMYCHLNRKQNQSPKINLFWPLNKPEGLFYRCMNLNFNINSYQF